ncbi:MAG: hypothetical protein ACLP9S_04595 [Syntrophales bacterium]
MANDFQSKSPHISLVLWVISIVLLLIQWGLQLRGITVNEFWGWVLLVLAYLLGVWALWIWLRSRNWHLLWRIIIVCIVGVFYFGLLIHIQPQKQFAVEDLIKKFEETISKSKSPLNTENPPPKRVPVQQSEVQIKLIFKNSPLFTTKRKQRFTAELNGFRNYLLGIGFEVPKETPPIGIGSGKGATGGFVSHGDPVSDYDIYIGRESIDDLLLLRRIYASFVFNTLFQDSLKTEIDYSGLTIMIFSDYFARSFANQSPENNTGFDGWLNALWEIRNICSQDFMDRSLYYMTKIKPQNEKDFNKYFSYRLLKAARIVDNNFQDIPKMVQILKKYNLL